MATSENLDPDKYSGPSSKHVYGRTDNRNPYEATKFSSEIRRFAENEGYQTTQKSWDNYKSRDEIKDMMSKAASDLNDFAKQTALEKNSQPMTSSVGGTLGQNLTSQTLSQTTPDSRSGSTGAQVYPAGAGGGGGGTPLGLVAITVDICVDGSPKKLDVYAKGSPY